MDSQDVSKFMREYTSIMSEVGEFYSGIADALPKDATPEVFTNALIGGLVARVIGIEKRLEPIEELAREAIESRGAA